MPTHRVACSPNASIQDKPPQLFRGWHSYNIYSFLIPRSESSVFRLAWPRFLLATATNSFFLAPLHDKRPMFPPFTITIVHHHRRNPLRFSPKSGCSGRQDVEDWCLK
ncbi:hypothetical protein EVAR_76269_1 [Eumeta japonica]|uniref:Uncharacterized protein n=1 Tax=Eumeta variegata TaxID=151549 RepID=A0A4C1UQQ4_EUMVA|nr:hypothetical protein EVAR_76269_1 [Eumeta japonica]